MLSIARDLGGLRSWIMGGSCPKKLGRAPKGSDRIPTIHFQVLAVSSQEGKGEAITLKLTASCP